MVTPLVAAEMLRSSFLRGKVWKYHGIGFIQKKKEGEKGGKGEGGKDVGEGELTALWVSLPGDLSNSITEQIISKGRTWFF